MIVWLEVEMKCSVLFEDIVAAVLGKLKLLFFAYSACINVSLFIALGVLIEFFVSEVSCL